MSFHTFGDSHSYRSHRVIQHHLGPLLCYSFGRDKLERCDIRNFGVNDGDTIMFCLGEIDCRCHIYKHVTGSRSYQQIIDEIVENYMNAIKLNLEVSNLKLKNVCVYNVVPPVRRHNTPEDPSFPYLGTDDERKSYSLYFNKKLKEKCQENGFVFFDIYDKYADEDGFLIKSMSDGRVHIADHTFIEEFINSHLL